MRANKETGLVFYLEEVRSPCGPLVLATDDQESLCSLLWEVDNEDMRRLLAAQFGERNVSVAPRRSGSAARLALEKYLAGDLRAIDSIPVRTLGTPFQREVWAALRTIPAGSTMSYGALASQLNRAEAVRAVGLANGSNPIAVVVPCHRVIGADGSLTGYGGGLERKRWLLEHEGVDVSRLKLSGRNGRSKDQLRLGF